MLHRKTTVIESMVFASLLALGGICSAIAQSRAVKPDSVKTSEKKADISNVKVISEKKAETKSEILVTFIELGSVNCIPCKMMQPVMKEVEEKYGKQVKVVFHDVWTEAGKPFGATYGIRAIPTQVFLDKDGKEYYRHEGFFAKEELVKILAMKDVNL